MANGIARAQAQGRGFRVGPNFTPRQAKLQKGPGGPGGPMQRVPGGRMLPVNYRPGPGVTEGRPILQPNTPSRIAGGNIGRFTRPSGFRGLAGLRGSAIDPGFGGIPSGRVTNPVGAVGARPGQSTTPGLGAPRAPAINLGGGRGFRNAGNRQRQARAGGGAINLAALGVKPMRNPGNLATLAGRRAANAGMGGNVPRWAVTHDLTPAQRRAAATNPRAGGGGRKLSNPVARAAARGRGF